MELRWLKGKWGFGSYKLQYREGLNHPQGKYWHDVPPAEEAKEKSLEEKLETDFVDCWNRVCNDPDWNYQTMCRALAKTATEHFKAT